VKRSPHLPDVRFDAKGLVANAGVLLPATLPQHQVEAGVRPHHHLLMGTEAAEPYQRLRREAGRHGSDLETPWSQFVVGRSASPSAYIRGSRGPPMEDGRSRQDEAMNVEVQEAGEDDRAVVRRLLQLYHYDFSEIDGSDVDPHGEYLHRYFDEYWIDPDRKAFLFRVDGAWAGLALIFVGEPHDVAEFFVMCKYRRHGVGIKAAALLFDRFPGCWTVRQQRLNPAATAFWRKAIPYPFQEAEHEVEIVQTFTTGPH
jgi:predicted acetyltransferase